MAGERFVSASIAAQNTFSTPVTIGAGRSGVLSISGTFVATVVLQRKFFGEADSEYVDIFSATAAAEKVFDNPTPAIYRAGVKTGGYTSGTAKVKIGF